ncbi:tyrosine recombinase XerC [Clostridium sp. D2Q-14]|uniref:tyrosine recombinase XerC n=1 Tax=Anaeromonas gelatinilytica TaxID=2683194 RepID=UPI00193B8C75|nr:tyrosine recombinase XerC [Anaeromonas gelatinilytica]MBS4535978.1 tyrosine recombinase XerC [Anaeromonas gelatinilytica]
MHDIPIFLEDFLNYLDTIKGKSKNTIREYYYDLRTFLRYLKIRYRLVPNDIEFDEIDVSDFDSNIMKKVTLQDLFSYISFVDKQRNNSSTTRARKVASIKSFFRYLHSIVNLIDENPAVNLETPKLSSKHPSYLTLNESLELLNNIKGQYPERDYAILMLFLNCGLRISELVSIDIDRIKDDTLTVTGKGDKERTIYLNESCIYAINEYLKIRPKSNIKDPKALFLSKRKNRLSVRAVQHLVKKHLGEAGLDTEKISTHKLRHTAATLMYKHGNVDIRALQQILGHTSVSTTQIYTHLDDDKLRQAVKSNPLSKNTKK